MRFQVRKLLRDDQMVTQTAFYVSKYPKCSSTLKDDAVLWRIVTFFESINNQAIMLM